jgi:hypothetical protein
MIVFVTNGLIAHCNFEKGEHNGFIQQRGEIVMKLENSNGKTNSIIIQAKEEEFVRTICEFAANNRPTGHRKIPRKADFKCKIYPEDIDFCKMATKAAKLTLN